ncbi:hypothetical protein BGW42_001984 [Actinomortierella wolfii]|nr:hypothetical protein BGW42_001984 [Actinomortierella wolfii]
MVVNFQEGIAPLHLITTAVSSSLLNNSGNQCACASRQSSYQSLNILASDYSLITWDCRSKLGGPSPVQREIQRLFQLYQMGLTAHPDAIGTKREQWYILRNQVRQIHALISRYRSAISRLLDLEKTFRLWQPQFEAMDKFEEAEERRQRHQIQEKEQGHQLALDQSNNQDDPIMAACRAFLIETGVDDPVDWFLKRPSEIDLALVKIEGELATLYKLTLSLQKNLAVQLCQLQTLEKAVMDECRLLDGASSCTQVLSHLEKFFRPMAQYVDVHPKHDEPSFLLQTTIAGSKRHVPQENVDNDTFGWPAKHLTAGEDDYPLRASDNVPILHSIFDIEDDQDDKDVDINGGCSLLPESDEISEQDDEQHRSGNVSGPFRPRSLEKFLSALHFRPSLLVSRFERWIEEAPTRECLEVNEWVSKCLRDDFLDNDRDDYVLGIVNNQNGAGEENGDEHFLSDDGQLWDQEKEAKTLTLRFCESTFEEAMQRITVCHSKAIPVTITCPSESPTATESPVFNYIEESQEYARPAISKHVFDDCWMTTTETEAYEQGEHLSASNSGAFNSGVNFNCGGNDSETPCRRLLNASMEVFDFSLDDLLVQLVPETDKVDSLGSSSTSSVEHPVILVGVGRWKEFDFPTSYSSSQPPSQQPSSLAGVSRDDTLFNQHYPSPICGYCHHHYPTSVNDLQKCMRSSRYPLVHLFTLPDFLCSDGEVGLPNRRSTRSQEHQEDQPFNSVESATQDNDDNQKYLESLTQQLVFLDDQAADMWAGTRQEKEVLIYHRWMACWHQRALWRL